MQLTVDPINRTFILDIDPVVDKDLKIVDLTTDLVTALQPPQPDTGALDALLNGLGQEDVDPACDCNVCAPDDEEDEDAPFRTMPELDAIFSRILLLP